VPIDSSLYIHSITKLYLDGRFNNFVYHYYIDHLPEWKKYKTPTEFAARYKNTPDAWEKLVAFAAKDSINLKNIPTDDKREIEERIKAYLARLRWRTQGFYEVANSTDNVVKQALKTIYK
jgi:carboxyl-terminal processing protease